MSQSKTDAVRAILLRAESKHAADWTQAERDAYDAAGGWREGANAVRELRVAEIIKAVERH